MLNQAEFLQLKSSYLSHMARTLYVFYLKPEVIKGHNQINLVELTSKLASLSPNFPIHPSSEQVSAALDELEKLKLVTYVAKGDIAPYGQQNPNQSNAWEMAKVNQALASWQGQAPYQGYRQGQAQSQGQGQNQGFYNQFCPQSMGNDFCNPQGAYSSVPYSSGNSQGSFPPNANRTQDAMYPKGPNGQASCACLQSGNGSQGVNQQQGQANPYSQQLQQTQYAQHPQCPAPSLSGSAYYPSRFREQGEPFQGEQPFHTGQASLDNGNYVYQGQFSGNESGNLSPQDSGNGIHSGASGDYGPSGTNAPVNFTKQFRVEYEDNTKQDPWRWQGAFIALPLFSQSSAESVGKPFRMFSDWQPGPTIAQAAHRAGVVDYSFDAKVLQEFVSYWQTRGDERTQFAWERAFIQRLIKLNQIADIKERELHKPNFKKSRHHEFQTLKSIFTGSKEYVHQPGLETLTTHLLGDSTRSDLKTQYASTNPTLSSSLISANGRVDSSLLPSLAQATGVELEDDDIMIIPGYTQPTVTSPFANGGYITPPSVTKGKELERRLSPKDLLEQLSAYSASEVEDILYKLSKNRKFAAVFDTGEEQVAAQVDPTKTIPLTPPSKINPELAYPLSNLSPHTTTDTNEGQVTPSLEQTQILVSSTLVPHESQAKRCSGKRKQDNTYVPMDIDKLKPYI